MFDRFVMMALLLQGGAVLGQSANAPGQGGGLRDRDPIDVQVVNNTIVVEEQEAHTDRSHGTIVWRLQTGGYAFPNDGIVFESNDVFACRVWGEERRFMRCQKRRHDSGARYKYVVNLVDARQNYLTPLDPWVVND